MAGTRYKSQRECWRVGGDEEYERDRASERGREGELAAERESDREK